LRLHWLGLGVAAHIFAITLQAFPSPAGGLTPSSWRDPTVQAEFQTWAARLPLGWDAAELEAHAWTFATSWEHARDLLLTPFRPYYRHAGTWQAWKMFVAPHTHPTRLEIEVQRPDGWFLAFEERSSEHTWLARELDSDRSRALVFRMGWPQYGLLRRQFAHWVAARAAVDWPEAQQVKVWFRKEVTPTPEQVRSGAKLEWTAVFPIVLPVQAVKP
jgi:hypothetical protein